MICDSNNKVAFKWANQNPDIVHLSLNILGLFSTLNIVTNQVGSLLIDLNNTNVSKTSSGKNAIAVTGKTSNRGNIITMESDIRNKRVEELKRDRKVGFKI